MRTTVWKILGLGSVLLPQVTHAAVFDGPSNGMVAGLDRIRNKISGLFQGDLTTVILTILAHVLEFVGLIAVIVIIVAGIQLIIGGGSDDSLKRAKNMILYTVIGLVLIIASRLIIGFVLQLVQP